MNYNELEKITSKYISASSTVPQDMFLLAENLKIKVKNSIECKIDYKTTNTPLSQCNAIFSTFNGQNVIYYDEKNPYKNMAIASQIAYYILHKEMEIIDHSDLARTATLLIAPKNSIKKNKIPSALKLSEICLIPIDDAKNYWEYLNFKKNKNPEKIKKIAFAALASVCFGYTVFSQNTLIDTTPTEVYLSDQAFTATTLPSTNNVWITKSGSKYHSPDCIYIKNKDNTLEVSIQEAENLNYLPCTICQ